MSQKNCYPHVVQLSFQGVIAKFEVTEELASVSRLQVTAGKSIS